MAQLFFPIGSCPRTGEGVAKVTEETPTLPHICLLSILPPTNPPMQSGQLSPVLCQAHGEGFKRFSRSRARHLMGKMINTERVACGLWPERSVCSRKGCLRGSWAPAELPPFQAEVFDPRKSIPHHVLRTANDCRRIPLLMSLWSNTGPEQ